MRTDRNHHQGTKAPRGHQGSGLDITDPFTGPARPAVSDDDDGYPWRSHRSMADVMEAEAHGER